jgi:hypothetical protein
LEAAKRGLENALKDLQDGLADETEVQTARLAVFDAEMAVGSIDARGYHRARADLFRTELTRVEKLVRDGWVARIELETRRMRVAYEEFRAGGAPEAYAQSRQAYATWLEQTLRESAEAGKAPGPAVQAAARGLQTTFPAIEPRR